MTTRSVLLPDIELATTGMMYGGTDTPLLKQGSRYGTVTKTIYFDPVELNMASAPQHLLPY
jgi:hypothetical protein